MAKLPSIIVSLLPTLLLAGCPGDEPGTSDTDTGVADTGATGMESTGGDDVDMMTTGSADESWDTGNGGVSGEELYLGVCASCHGMMGEGTSLGYELQHPVRLYSNWVVRNGRPGTEFMDSVMSAYGPDVISDEQLEEIWDYLGSFPQPTTGETLYLDYCRNCHGIDAYGGVTGVNLHEPGAMLEIFEKVREGENTGNPGARNSYMPAFDATWLTDAEIQMIADHIATL